MSENAQKKKKGEENSQEVRFIDEFRSADSSPPPKIQGPESNEGFSSGGIQKSPLIG